jgi:hypothetical protein
MGTDREYLKDLKDATPEDRKLAAELEQAERKRGIPQPGEEKQKQGGAHGRG